MVGVDRGNRPAKGGTNCCQSAKHRHRPIWQVTTCRHLGTLYHISWSRSLTHYTHRMSVWPASHLRLLMFRTDLRHDWSRVMPETGGSTSYQFTWQSGPLDSRAVRHALGNAISTIRSPSAVHSVRLCCRSQLWLYVLLYGLAVPAATAAYRAYCRGSRGIFHNWCNIDVLLALFYTTITQLQWSRVFLQPCRK